MERIKLTKQEKEVLRLVNAVGKCPDTYPLHVFCECVGTLEQKGLVKVMWAEGHEFVDVRMTATGQTYMALNPELRNPVDWKWVVSSVIAVIGLVVSVAALLISCGNVAIMK